MRYVNDIMHNERYSLWLSITEEMNSILAVVWVLRGLKSSRRFTWAWKLRFANCRWRQGFHETDFPYHSCWREEVPVSSERIDFRVRRADPGYHTFAGLSYHVLPAHPPFLLGSLNGQSVDWTWSWGSRVAHKRRKRYQISAQCKSMH